MAPTTFTCVPALYLRCREGYRDPTQKYPPTENNSTKAITRLRQLLTSMLWSSPSNAAIRVAICASVRRSKSGFKGSQDRRTLCSKNSRRNSVNILEGQATGSVAAIRNLRNPQQLSRPKSCQRVAIRVLLLRRLCGGWLRRGRE